MSALIVLLLAAAAAAFVGYPLWSLGPCRRVATPGRAPAPVLVRGVAYESLDEWAFERQLGRADDGVPESQDHLRLLAAEDEVERQVAALRAESKPARARGKRVTCPECGKAFQAGDRFCARCGASHPRVCPGCGERHRVGDCFCPHCGATLPAEDG